LCIDRTVRNVFQFNIHKEDLAAFALEIG
jgi:hypothetical protein